MLKNLKPFSPKDSSSLDDFLSYLTGEVAECVDTVQVVKEVFIGVYEVRYSVTPGTLAKEVLADFLKEGLSVQVSYPVFNGKNLSIDKEPVFYCELHSVYDGECGCELFNIYYEDAPVVLMKTDTYKLSDFKL